MPLAVEYATPGGGFARGTACAGAFPPRWLRGATRSSQNLSL